MLLTSVGTYAASAASHTTQAIQLAFVSIVSIFVGPLIGHEIARRTGAGGDLYVISGYVLEVAAHTKAGHLISQCIRLISENDPLQPSIDRAYLSAVAFGTLLVWLQFFAYRNYRSRTSPLLRFASQTLGAFCVTIVYGMFAYWVERG